MSEPYELYKETTFLPVIKKPLGNNRPASVHRHILQCLVVVSMFKVKSKHFPAITYDVFDLQKVPDMIL